MREVVDPSTPECGNRGWAQLAPATLHTTPTDARARPTPTHLLFNGIQRYRGHRGWSRTRART